MLGKKHSQVIQNCVGSSVEILLGSRTVQLHNPTLVRRYEICLTIMILYSFAEQYEIIVPVKFLVIKGIQVILPAGYWSVLVIRAIARGSRGRFHRHRSDGRSQAGARTRGSAATRWWSNPSLPSR